MMRHQGFRERDFYADGWLTWLLVPLVALIIVLLLATIAAGATAYYSFTGAFTNGTETQSFLFDLNSALRPPAPFTLQTWHYGGGTNAAGDTIVAGGFDPILRLYNDTPALIAENDDFNPPTVRDSLIDWSTSGMPIQLPADGYQLNLVAYNNTLGGRTGNWAVDLVSDAAKFTLTGVDKNDGTGATTINSLTMGSDDVRLPAKVQIAPLESLSLVGQLIVGDTGAGDVTVTTGALTTNTAGGGSPILGYEAGSVGTVTLKQGGSWLDTMAMVQLGWEGTGNLVIESGGIASFNNVVILGEYPSGEGNLTVRGLDSILVTNESLSVGDSGMGYVRIEDRGRIQTLGDFYGGGDLVGAWSQGRGIVEVDGKDSLWSSSTFIVGNYGQGTVSITNGGKIAVANNAYVGLSSASHDNSVTISGAAPDGTRSHWDIHGSLYVGGSETGPGGTATLTIASGGSVGYLNTLQVWEPGTIVLDTPDYNGYIEAHDINLAGGTLEGQGLLLLVDELNNAGVVAPGGQSAGRIYLGDGHYQQTDDGLLSIQLGGTDPSQYDRLDVWRWANLNGTLRVSLLPGFTPAAGNSFEILTASNLDVTYFDDHDLPDLGSDLGWEVDYSSGSSVVLRVVSSIPGDYNASGTVDAADYIVWRKTYSGPNVLPISQLADGDGDGDVDDNDFGVWRTHFGQTAPPIVPGAGSTFNAIPEPTSLWLALMALVGWVVRPRQPIRVAIRWVRPRRANPSYSLAGAMGIMISIGMSAVAISASAATLFRDDFNGSLNSAWSIVRPDASFYSIQPTYLDVLASNGDIWQWRTDAKNLFLIDNPTAGDFAVTLKVNSFAPTVNYTQIDILAYDDDDNHVRAGYGHLDAQRRLDNASEIAGHFSGHGLTAQDFGASPFWLQLRKAGTLYSLFFSTDGTSYSPASNPHIYGDGTPAKLGFVVMVDPYQNTHALLDWFAVSEPVLGDYNLNGDVDAADYVVWRKTFGGPNVQPISLAADGDGDGDVDDDDYGVWRAHFGQTAASAATGSASENAPIPEPASLWLALMALALVGWVARPRQPICLANRWVRSPRRGTLRCRGANAMGFCCAINPSYITGERSYRRRIGDSMGSPAAGEPILLRCVSLQGIGFRRKHHVTNFVERGDRYYRLRRFCFSGNYGSSAPLPIAAWERTIARNGAWRGRSGSRYLDRLGTQSA